MWYHVSDPNTYLVVTGAGIATVKIAKKAFVFPFQKVTKISVTPFDFSMSLHAMTSEKIRFSLPAVFTIGPRDSSEALMKYAILLTGNSDGTAPSSGKAVATGRNHVQDIVKGIIEGETRSIVSTMTMEELFNNRKIFKDNVIANVQGELDHFGLRIYNANVKELQDMPGSQYFEFLSLKAHEGAQNQAKVDVANARMLGEVGEAERHGEAKQKIAKINAHTAVLETERKVEKATADSRLRSREIEIERELNIEGINAKRAAEQRDVELQKLVELKKAEMELERQRAVTVTKAKVDRESSQQHAEGQAYAQTKLADARKYEKLAEADARLIGKTRDAEAAFITTQKAAEANFITRQREAEAGLIARQKEAQGLIEISKAYGALSQVLGGPQGLMQYMMLQNGVYQTMADANAKAIQGLQPKINVWNTGSAGGEGVDSTAPIRNLLQCLPPMLSTIQDQTGMKPPAWLAQMPEAGGINPDGMAEDQIVRHGEKSSKQMVNGAS